eukprot:TRINITY_DN10181_c0_g1_i2.p1 TRINITY_DN10181_c0_g1~~TRINITY_DN10181_c0_g1_i2.p1  ORF type:complete len:425 (+),score=69.14 TRINITY_DN10181_c0_g1_i2:178-1275(+)
MSLMIRRVITESYKAYLNKEFIYIWKLPIPEFLSDWREATSLALSVTMLYMLSQEPIYWCATHQEALPNEQKWDGAGIFTLNCPEAVERKQAYSTGSMIAMLLYWFLVVDLTIFSNQVSAYVLVAGRVLCELLLFLGAWLFLITTFASSITCLNQKNKDFQGIPTAFNSLLQIALGIFTSAGFQDIQKDVFVLISVCIFIVVAWTFLLNLLIAQLNGAYASAYDDMVGYARLNRGKVICEMIEQGVPARRWEAFIMSLGLDVRLEFNEGDVGIAGGIQVLEPANANPTTEDLVRRAGGSTSPSAQWPEESTEDDDTNMFDRIEKLAVRATKAATEGKGRKGGKSGASRGGSSLSDGASGSDEGSA